MGARTSPPDYIAMTIAAVDTRRPAAVTAIAAAASPADQR